MQVLRSRFSAPTLVGQNSSYRYLGQTFDEKLKHLREILSKKNAAGIVVNMLDEVAWLFNLRGSDIDFNPGMQAVLT